MVIPACILAVATAAAGQSRQAAPALDARRAGRDAAAHLRDGAAG
jgi:hypothetical protein